MQEESILTPAGYEEHRLMGQRWKSRMGDFIDKDKTEIRTSHKNRAESSSEGFTEGMFGKPMDYYNDDSVAR